MIETFQILEISLTITTLPILHTIIFLLDDPCFRTFIFIFSKLATRA